MIEKMISKFKTDLPSTIETLSFGGGVLNFSTQKWTFSGMCAWRVIHGNRVVFACYDDNSEMKVLTLIGQNIIQIGVQSDRLMVDPIFFLSNHCVLEIFSMNTFEPWTLNYING